MIILQDQTPNQQEIVQNEFFLQIQDTQQLMTRELNEAQEVEYELNQMLCEAQEVRTWAEQERQSTLAQFRNVSEWETNQEAVGRLLNDSCSDAWQDIHSLPHSIIPDSGVTFT